MSRFSRFTDSKKYEDDFLECFKLAAPRQGEICNACVLLVKRWKKLPAGSDRNWQHVVDARAGPGMKSLTKFKSRLKKTSENEILKKKRFFEREYSPALSDKSDNNEDSEVVEVDFLTEDGPSVGSSSASPGESDNEDSTTKPDRYIERSVQSNVLEISDFIDETYWKSENSCCGTFFRGLNGEVLVDPRFFKPCKCRLLNYKRTKEAKMDISAPKGTILKTYSDSSSDSGYDESSNQGSSSENSFKKEIVRLDTVNHKISKSD